MEKFRVTELWPPEPAVDLEAVKQNGFAFMYVKRKKRTPEICLEAVRQEGYALEYVKEQTPEICLEAVRQINTIHKFF